MKVEHHVTIHSGLKIHAPVFAESMEEAERLGREWALAQFAASGYDPEWLQLQAEVVTPRPEQLIRAVYASPGDPAEVVLLCGDRTSLQQLFGGQIDVALRLGDLVLLTQQPSADAFFEPPDRMLELTAGKEIIIKFRSHELEALFSEGTVYNRRVAMYQSAVNVKKPGGSKGIQVSVFKFRN